MRRSESRRELTRRFAARAVGRSLFEQIRRARIWFPATIVGVVVVYQLAVVPLGGENWQFWAQLLFYGILGPTATFVTLDWIAIQVREREQAQEEMAGIYRELRASHELLADIQGVTERFVTAPDLEAALATASEGIARVTGAVGALVTVGEPGGELVSTHGLDDALREHALERGRLLLAGESPDDEVEIEGLRYWVLGSRLAWAGQPAGTASAYYRYPPTGKERDGFAILASEFSAAAEAVVSRTRDLVTLFEVDRSIRAEGNLDRLLDSLLAHMVSRVDAELGGVYLADDEGLLHLRTSYGLPSVRTNQTLRPGQGVAGRVALEREARLYREIPPGDRTESTPFLELARSAVALPLLGEGVLIGVVVLAHGDPDRFDESVLPFLGLMASQVSLAIRNARAYLHSEELAIAEERARIAREIHDGVAQSLAFSALKLDLVERVMERNTEMAARELATARDTIRETIKEVRRSIFALRPVELERHGFMETLRRYLADYGQQNEIAVVLSEESVPRLSNKGEAVLFRIFQEAMNNVAKHARARNVRVLVGSGDNGGGFIEVVDDGRGFDPAQVSDRVTSAGGLGLVQMRERVEARGGTFRVESAPGGGTRVFASVRQ